MKFSVAVLALALGVATAAPFNETESDTNALDIRAISRPQHCAIVGGASSVNCRSKPNTGGRVVRKLSKGTVYSFWCVNTGPNRECVTINGSRNCGWHYLRESGCYVNGHYTDNHCTLGVGWIGSIQEGGNFYFKM